MSLFEMLSAVIVGIVAGVALAALGRWRRIGFLRIISLGALGGAVGGLIGNAASVSGPVWGEMGYHPMVALFACFGGASAVAAVRLLLGGGPGERRASTVRQERPSR
jgi:uncharacterized membrane protein YeaQ/YmgE (transglycosylase-associated protein family)